MPKDILTGAFGKVYVQLWKKPPNFPSGYTMNESSCCSSSSPAISIISLLDFCCCNNSVVISHFYFNLYFCSDKWC